MVINRKIRNNLQIGNIPQRWHNEGYNNDGWVIENV